MSDQLAMHARKCSPPEAAKTNAMLARLTPVERIRWASDTFGDLLAATTSAGRDAALLWNMLAAAEVGAPLLLADTGFLHPDTLSFRDELVGRYPKIRLHQSRPDAATLAQVSANKLWRQDPATFMELTKMKPLAQLQSDLGRVVIMSAIHRDQTPNRGGLNFFECRPDGTYRVHPFLDWTQVQVRDYIARNNLPSNPLPLLTQGVSHRQIVFVDGDVERLPIEECGLNVVDGRLVRRARQ